MTKIWIDVQFPWPWQVCVLAMVVEVMLLVVTLPRGLRILRHKVSCDGSASESYIRRVLMFQGTILGISGLAVAALYGYDLCAHQMESALLGEEASTARYTLTGLRSLVPSLLGLGLWGGLGLLVGRRARNNPST